MLAPLATSTSISPSCLSGEILSATTWTKITLGPAPLTSLALQAEIPTDVVTSQTRAFNALWRNEVLSPTNLPPVETTPVAMEIPRTEVPETNLSDLLTLGSPGPHETLLFDIMFAYVCFYYIKSPSRFSQAMNQWTSWIDNIDPSQIVDKLSLMANRASPDMIALVSCLQIFFRVMGDLSPNEAVDNAPSASFTERAVASATTLLGRPRLPQSVYETRARLLVGTTDANVLVAELDHFATLKPVIRKALITAFSGHDVQTSLSSGRYQDAFAKILALADDPKIHVEIRTDAIGILRTFTQADSSPETLAKTLPVAATLTTHRNASLRLAAQLWHRELLEFCPDPTTTAGYTQTQLARLHQALPRRRRSIASWRDVTTSLDALASVLRILTPEEKQAVYRDLSGTAYAFTSGALYRMASDLDEASLMDLNEKILTHANYLKALLETPDITQAAFFSAVSITKRPEVVLAAAKFLLSHRKFDQALSFFEARLSQLSVEDRVQATAEFLKAAEALKKSRKQQDKLTAYRGRLTRTAVEA